MSRRACKTRGCTEAPEPTFAWCITCLTAWGETRRRDTTADAAVSGSGVVVHLDVSGPAGARRCSNCTGHFPVLVDDVLCVRCDSILFPTTPAPHRPAVPAAALREAS